MSRLSHIRPPHFGQLGSLDAIGPVAGETAGSSENATSVSRSIGAAFGTALVGTVLFAFLSIRNPEAARVFAMMVERGVHAPIMLSGEQRVAVQADIADAFRAAFLLIAGFTTCGFFLALTNPMRRI